MADYNINAVTRRVVFSGSAGVGPYAFTFEILAQTDIAVYKNSTKLTLTTDYTVTINANGTGSVTLVVAATGSDTITVIGSRAIERTTDFVTAGDLLASSLNEQLDSQIVMIQQLAEENKRTIKAPAYDPADVADGGTANLTLPAAADRSSKILAFDASGNPIATEEIGEWKGNWAASTTYAKRDIVKDASNSNVYRANTAHTSSGSTPISSNADAAKWDLVVDAAAASASAAAAAASESAAAASQSAAAASQSAAATSATNAASSASSASTSATNAASSATAASNAQTAAEAARDAALAAYDSFDDRYLGAKASNPATDNDGNALLTGALYYNTAENELRVYTGAAWDRVGLTFAQETKLDAIEALADVTDAANVTTAIGNMSSGNIESVRTALSLYDIDDFDAAALIASFTTAPSTSLAKLIDTTIQRLKVTGIWAELDAFVCLKMPAEDQALRNWKDASTITKSGTLTWTANTGYTGDASTGYIDLGFAPGASTRFQETSAHLSVYCEAGSVPPATRREIGQASSANAWIEVFTAGSAALIRMNESSAALAELRSAAPGNILANRTPDGLRKIYEDGVEIDSAAVGTSVVGAGNFTLFRSSATYSDRQLSFATVGGGLSAAQVAELDAIIDYFRTGTVSYSNTTQKEAARRKAVKTAISSSGTLTLDCSDADNFRVLLNENVSTLTFTNLGVGNRSITVEFTQDSTGSRTVSYTGFRCPGGVAPVMSSTAGAVDIVVFRSQDDGTTIDAYSGGFAMEVV